MAAPAQSAEHSGPPEFGSWVTARAHALTRFAYVLTGRLEEADDVVQDALSAAYIGWSRAVSSSELESRLRTRIVRAYVGRWGRGRRAPRPERELDLWLPTPGSAGRETEPEDVAVWERCRTLMPRPRAALVLSCYEGLSEWEVAEVMGGREKRVRADLDTALATVAPDVSPSHGSRTAQVRHVLLEYAEHAPPAQAPADRAVARSRRERRRRMTTGATLASALAVPVIWGLVAGSGAPAPPPTPPVPDADARSLELDGWRWESWGGVQVQVPGDWGHADLTQWCTGRGPDGPAVDRPGLASTHALCTLGESRRPVYTGGLLLRRAESGVRLSRADVAPYATTRIHTVGGVTLTVIDIDPEVGSAILSSAEVIGRRDYNGCEPHRVAGRSGMTVFPERPTPIARLDAVSSVSVCRYGLTGWKRPTLISSRRLTGTAADDTLAALQAAPVQPLSEASGRCRGPMREYAVLELWHDGKPTSAVVGYDGCRLHGIDDGSARRGLTAEVLDPILAPPWTGDLAADVQGSGRTGGSAR